VCAARCIVVHMTLTMRYRAGTIEIAGALPDDEDLCAIARYDVRAACFRAEAQQYGAIRKRLVARARTVVDEIRADVAMTHPLAEDLPLRAYQEGALDAWWAADARGVVVLPTGAGKTRLGIAAIARRAVRTLVVAPTLDLVWQWHGELARAFGRAPGVVGGGEHDVQDLTVTTYDSAFLHAESLGARFGMLVFDEVHHLPSPAYRAAAQLSAAPYRLGLSATPERDDGAHEALTSLIGSIVYRVEVDALRGEYLADYDVETVPVALSDEERRVWDEARATYLAFVRSKAIPMGARDGFVRFLRAAASSSEGRRALDAYRAQKMLAECAPGKIDVVLGLLDRHAHGRALVFTRDNKTAYAIARRALIPAITHQTKVSERTAVLDALRHGDIGAVVTSRVLNEGVDVPDADVAIVVSGSGTVREHVQRLGRVLRPRDGKRARLYELVTEGTGEEATSRRRREHVAYR
jgi:superfamily II DNA or RNA helicase